MEFLQFEYVKVLVSVAVIGFLWLLISLYMKLVAKPERIRGMLRKQGIVGPLPTSWLLGNIMDMKKAYQNSQHQPTITSHNVAAAIFPYNEECRKQYGEVFSFSLGNKQILHVSKPEMVREIVTCTSLDLGKPSYLQNELGPFLGRGILTTNGAVWAHQNKTIAPELYMVKVKGMINLITESTMIIVKSLKSRVEKEGGIADIKIDDYMRSFSGDVISRACFGSNYSKGEEIFLKLTALQELMGKIAELLGIPGMRYLPTKSNRSAWKLQKEIRNLILEVVKERKQKAAHEKDLLQMIIEGAESSTFNQEETDQFIVDNCKNIYVAAFEALAISATWCLMLLASNQEWQDRVRAEVVEICGDRTPDYEMLKKMKLLTMVIQETLRLYPPATELSRQTYKDMKFQDINIPKDVTIRTMVLFMHTNPEIWGPDAYEFYPERFANGISSSCKLPYVYMPFGMGPRVCVGQHLAMIELKILLSLILSNFSLSISPRYVHSPTRRLTIEPKDGVNLLVKKIHKVTNSMADSMAKRGSSMDGEDIVRIEF
ncbi:hypothetical protein Q3G72_002610 [Acer saccharum]|nr:hypothetical protein Q3G72_002610 [Acer saccharum]